MMNYLNNDIIGVIRENYDEMTAVEKNVADFFLSNKERIDFSSKNIAGALYVSEATLSRFSKKCGYKGYREFVYGYERYLEDANKYCDCNELTQKVLGTYQKLLDLSVRLVNEEQMNRMATFLTQAKRVYVYGMGSSGVAAKELQWRFMRTGLYVEAITDSHMIKMNSAIVDKDAMVIAISLSGKTKEILAGIRLAKQQGAKTILITGNRDVITKNICDEVLSVAVLKDLDKGINVSPQFPILVMVDIFYGYYFNNDRSFIRTKHTQTISALNQ